MSGSAKILQLQAISLSLTLFGGQGSSLSEFPSRRLGFEVKAPVPVALGKLWTDIGLFYPFPVEVRRADWERGFFQTMNRSTSESLPLRLLAAQALMGLRDPGALVLEKQEGKGDFFLPVLFHVKSHQVWINGGSREAVPQSIGPIEKINGVSIKEFLARYVGESPTEDQMAAALSFAAQRTESFSWSLLLGDGSTKVVAATKELPKDIWVEGGWDGVPLHQLVATSAQDLATVQRLDLRIAPWLRGGGLALNEQLEGLWPRLKATAKSNPVYLVSRQNIGYPDGSPTSVYTSKVILEPAPFIESAGAKPTFTVRWPQGGAVPVSLTQTLAGWALPADVRAIGASARYAFQDVDVILPTAVYGSQAGFRDSAYTGPVRGELPALGFANGRVLNRTAAKALATASMLNFDQLFGFTPEAFQQSLSLGLLGLYERAKNVPDLIFQAAPFNREPHSHVRQANGGTRTDVDEKIRHASTPERRFLPFRAINPTTDSLLVLVSTPEVASPIPIRAGARIKAINGTPIKQWLDQASLINPARPADRMRIGLELNYCLPTQGPLSVEFENPGEPSQVQAITPLTAKAYTEVYLPKAHAALPKGWTLVNQPQQLSYNDLLHRAETGENFLVDFRVPNALKGPRSMLVNTGMGYFIKTPTEPAPWGSPTDSMAMQAVSVTLGDPGTPQKGLRGRIVLLVWGENQSSTETMPLVLRTADGIHQQVFIVGLPTAGVTGPITTLRLPIGEEDGFAYYTPTGAWPFFRGRAIQYRGLPLDREFTIKDVLQRIEKGKSEDPLLDCAIEALKTLPARSSPWW